MGFKYQPFSFIDLMFGIESFSGLDELKGDSFLWHSGLGLNLNSFYLSLSYSPKTFDVKLPLTKFSIDFYF